MEYKGYICVITIILEISKEVKEIMYSASIEADIYNHNKIGCEHIAIALLSQEINTGIMLLVNNNIDVDMIYAKISGLLDSTISNVAINKKTKLPNKDFRNTLLKSEFIAKYYESEVVHSEHLLLALVSIDTEVMKIFSTYGVTAIFIKDYLSKYTRDEIHQMYTEKTKALNINNMGMNREEDFDGTGNGTIEPKIATRKNAKTPLLDEFGKDITQLALDGKLQMVFGREKEIERITQILSRKNKKNPILVGNAGVGKSVIVDGLALMITNGTAPKSLMGKRIISIEMAALISGTKYRGQFEERMKGIMNELRLNTNIIAFIDEIHTMVGAGSTGGSLDASNMLKPALARGEIQVIGATTFNEYKQTIEKDGALARRLQKVIIEEPNVEETKIILNNIKEIYETYHGVIYSDEVIDACVKLADRYVQDRAMPDKAIDILDEAGSLTKISDNDVPEELIKLQEDIFHLEFNEIKGNELEKMLAIKNSDFEKASKMRDIEKENVEKLNSLREELEKRSTTHKKDVSLSSVERVVSIMTNVPVEKLSISDNNNLLKIGDRLKNTVVGQDEAVDRVAKVVIRSKSGIRNPNRPASFLFMGPTGVGKTLLAKELANQVFGGQNSMIRFDMSEFMEKFSVSTLVGAPPGYVGHEQGGKLTEAVKQKPYSVILFDEIEKAHPDVFNIFLQILDDGRLTDSEGKTVSFKNTIIIMTSNVGVKELNNAGSGLGFLTEANPVSFRENEIIKKALKKKFAPEFLNRIGETIFFNKLNVENIKNIVVNELNILGSRLSDMGYTLKCKEALIDHLVEIGFDPEYGARPLNRAIETFIEDGLAEEIISKPDRAKKITLDINKTTKKLVIK